MLTYCIIKFKNSKKAAVQLKIHFIHKWNSTRLCICFATDLCFGNHVYYLRASEVNETLSGVTQLKIEDICLFVYIYIMYIYTSDVHEHKYRTSLPSRAGQIMLEIF